MFTGIIEEAGRVVESGHRLAVACATILSDLRIGSSIAVNGACLTAVAFSEDRFSADLSPETLARTSLGQLEPGSLVNLERSLAVGGRLDGHIVQGHVDGTGQWVEATALENGNWWVSIQVPAALIRYVIEKGSLAVDGISLTVAALSGKVASFAIIPHTWQHTNLHSVRPGQAVNLEVDMLAKYVEKLLEPRKSE